MKYSFKAFFSHILLYTSNSNNSVTYLRTFCTSIPATTPMVVGRLAAQTPSRFNVFSSIFAATTSGGAHWGAIKKLSCKNAFKKSHRSHRMLKYCMSCARIPLTRPANLHIPSPTLEKASEQFSRAPRTAKQADSPGMMSWMCPDTAFSLTPDSIQICPSSLQAL